MFSKKIYWIVVLMVMFPLSLAARSTWNVAVGDWEDLSGGQSPDAALLIQKTVADNLKRVKRFKIFETSVSNERIRGLSDATLFGRRVQADVILYGYYYEENNKIVVVTEVADVLKNQLKLRRVYHGPADIDLLDTIDEMSSDVKKRIMEILPPITLENEKEIRAIRKTLYKQKGISLKRVFYTRLGVDSEFGNPKVFTNIDSDTNNNKHTNYYTPSIYNSIVDMGMTLRYGWVRLDGSLSALSGVLAFDSLRGAGVYDRLSSTMRVAISGYLPFFDGQFAVGVGYLSLSYASKYSEYTDYNNTVKTNYDIQDKERGWSFFGTWNPNENWDLQFGFKLPWFLGDQWHYTTEPDKTNDTYGQKVDIDIPAIYLDALIFPFDEWGFEARFIYEKGTYYEGSYIHNKYMDGQPSEINIERSATLNQMHGYLGVVYRLNFL